MNTLNMNSSLGVAQIVWRCLLQDGDHEVDAVVIDEVDDTSGKCGLDDNCPAKTDAHIGPSIAKYIHALRR